MATDPVDSDLRLVVTFVRDAIASNAAVMRPDGRRRADSYAMAGLSHCCVLLDELDHLRQTENDLVAVLVGRALLETWLTATWIFFGRDDALDVLQGSYRKNMRTMEGNLKASIDRAKSRQAVTQARRDAAIVTNEKILARNAAKGIDIELRLVPTVPDVMEVDVDLTSLDNAVSGVPEGEITFETMALRIGPWAESKGVGGGNWDTVYHFLYRTLSTWGAHPTYWLFNTYFEVGPWMTHVKARPESDGRALTVTRAMVELTAMLSAEVFESCGIDVSPLRSFVQRARSETAYRRAIGTK
jgi:hypothetical protein